MHAIPGNLEALGADQMKAIVDPLREFLESGANESEVGRGRRASTPAHAGRPGPGDARLVGVESLVHQARNLADVPVVFLRELAVEPGVDDYDPTEPTDSGDLAEELQV